MTAAAVLACALILDAVLGEPDWLWSRLRHPAVIMGDAVAWLDRRLNHGDRRRWRGRLALAGLASGALGAGWLASLAGPAGEIVVAAVLLAQRSLVEHVGAVAAGLRRSVADGRDAVASIVSRDVAGMGPDGIARSAIESAAENLSDGVVAPAFWFLIGGLPGMVLYKAVNTADSMIGYRTETHADFGRAAARFDDLLNLVPARLTSLMIVLLSGRVGDWRAIAGDAGHHISPNAGWPEAAMARALGISLAGPRSYHGQILPLSWVNPDGRRDIGATEIENAVAMLWRVWAVGLGLTVAVAAVSRITLT